jgi:hypothetical protein
LLTDDELQLIYKLSSSVVFIYNLSWQFFVFVFTLSSLDGSVPESGSLFTSASLFLY